MKESSTLDATNERVSVEPASGRHYLDQKPWRLRSRRAMAART